MARPAPTAEGSAPDRLLTESEFDEIIRRKMTGGRSERIMRLTVTSVEAGDVVAIYQTANVPAEPASQARTFFEDRSLAVTCRCEMWPAVTPSREQPDDLMIDISELVKRHWGERDPATMLPYLKTAGVPARFTSAAQYGSEGSAVTAVLHTDLDHFKKVNDEVTETGGNEVLREFADRMRHDFGRMGVVVRTGGEEFSAILRADNVQDVIKSVIAFRRRMAIEPFARIARANTCSIGLSISVGVSGAERPRNHDQVLDHARKAEVRAKQEGRNRIALSEAIETTGTPNKISASDLQLAALTGQRQGGAGSADGPSFGLAVTDGLAQLLNDGVPIADAIAGIRNELSLVVGDFQADGDPPQELFGRLNALEWSSIVVRALFAAARTNHALLDPTVPLALTVDASGQLAVEAGGATVLLGCSVTTDEAIRAEAGRPTFDPGSAPDGGVTRLSASAAGGCDAQSPVLLLPIGDVAKAVAEEVRHVVAGIVDVDDRPTRGGGLPDFWQSNVSRVVRTCLDNPNVGCVIAIGETAHAHLTLERLKELSSRGTSTIQRTLSLRGEHLEAYAARDISLITVAADRGAVISAIAAAVAATPIHDFTTRPVIDPFMRTQRRLPIAPPNQGQRLDVIDGLRTVSLANAYPEALQLIRGTKHASEHEEPQRGTFREMTGFKVVLTDPFLDRVPDYWHPERSLLDDYYAKTFADAGGLFGKRLLNPHGTEVGAMTGIAVEQTVGAILRATPTRRINLPIVPETLDQPLGLGCIQLMPRLREGVAVLDPIFVWRTVDALVGFPFSAYGSIRWTEDFIVRVNDRLAAEGVDVKLRVGILTYIALSFHMYLHDGDMHIARTIVQDASL